MKLPSNCQQAYANLKLIEPILKYLRDDILGTEFDTLEIISDLDKSRMNLKIALTNIETLVKNSKV